jgi:hypothetical protein
MIGVDAKCPVCGRVLDVVPFPDPLLLAVARWVHLRAHWLREVLASA